MFAKETIFSSQSLAYCLWGKFADQIESYLREGRDESVNMYDSICKIIFFRGKYLSMFL